MANLIIVESPTKAPTIKSYLGSGYKVIASKGHIRDLPKSTLGVDLENEFAPHYINISGKSDVIKQLKKEVKSASKVFLATDPDREGEAISWHLATVLGISPDSKCRITFNEITKTAVKEAVKSPRAIDLNLVNAQQARRILDRIVGYKISPFLWKTVKSGLSAGRVQSVATRVIVEREEEIRAFVPKEFWTIEADLVSDAGNKLTVHYVSRKKPDCEAAAEKILADAKEGPFTVVSYKKSQKSKQPLPPFTTSTMQQEASKRLGFQVQRIMKVAQELYEGVNLGAALGGVQGLITYMRTDSLRIAPSAQEAVRELIRDAYGEAYVPTRPRVYRSKAGAQDAHEAIRPTNVAIRPSDVEHLLTPDQIKLYRLIWERFVSSQMSAAVYDTMTVDLKSGGDHLFRASGYNIRFKGFLSVFGGPAEEAMGDEDVRMARLPVLQEGAVMQPRSITKQQHFTEPPPRYNDASLIKMMEECGIGRPSTYTAIITTIIARNYVAREGKSLVPTSLGEVITGILRDSFADVVDVGFTAQMENDLDSIEHGDTTYPAVLGEFYQMFEKELEKATEANEQKRVAVPVEESEYECDKCGSRMVYKTGRYGRFLACPNYPACKNTKAVDKNGAPIEREKTEAESAGFACELCGADMLIRKGKFGTFFACSNYPKCRFTKQKTNDIGVTCPDCGAKVVTKFSRNRKMFYSCERYPECSFSSWDLPLAEKCPECGDVLLYKKSKKQVVCRNASCAYTRAEELNTPQES